MRPLHLKLVATVVLAVCVLLIIRQSVEHDHGASKPPLSRTVSKRVQNAAPPATTAAVEIPQVKDSNAPQPAPAAAAQPATAHAAQPTANPAAQSNTQPLGIRLADNVKLPAVIIALSDPNRDPEHKLPQPVLDCMQGIVDRFYQDLAASAGNQAGTASKPPGTSPDPTAPVTAADNNTVVIEPGPAVDKARARANEMYRALFGDEAYNRLTMNSALEVQLPVEAPASGASNH
ncbi:MAG: hypothetical protein WCP45_06265 [Verrucomicrobiota bacterium]